jgi:predicted secreted protein
MRFSGHFPALLATALALDVSARETPTAAPAQLPLSVHLTDEAIKSAVKETLATTPKAKREQLDNRVLSGDSYKKFSRAFSEAEIPSCVRTDALKHQPTSVEYGGWVFGVASIYATPFWAYAALTGKCHMKLD